MTLVERNSEGVWQESSENNKLVIEAAKENTPAKVTVGNDAGVAFPSTGGSGIHLLYLIGSTLVILAGAGLILRRAREE